MGQFPAESEYEVGFIYNVFLRSPSYWLCSFFYVCDAVLFFKKKYPKKSQQNELLSSFTRNASSAKCLVQSHNQTRGIAERYPGHSENPPRTATISLHPIRLNRYEYSFTELLRNSKKLHGKLQIPIQYALEIQLQILWPCRG
jgi:hypothetical protein